MRTLILILTCLFLAIPCQGEIIIVDNDGPNDFNNIQAAIDYSNHGDVIYVFPGTYTGPGNRDIDFRGKAITVQSVAPDDPYSVAATIIDCNRDGRGFNFHSGEDANSILDGLTIINGYPGEFEEGGGIYSGSSSPTIANCTIGENMALYGGGISCYLSTATITNCTISENSAQSGVQKSGFSCKFVENCLRKGKS